MARYTYALRGSPTDPKDEIRIEEKSVALDKGEQNTEHYLCDINPAGEVCVRCPLFCSPAKLNTDATGSSSCSSRL
jgi:hypothetical protein